MQHRTRSLQLHADAAAFVLSEQHLELIRCRTHAMAAMSAVAADSKTSNAV
jgi:hypothetical protein